MEPSLNETKHDDFYRRLRSRISAFLETKTGALHPYAEFLLVAPDFFYLLLRLMRDPAVPAAHKARLGMALGYFLTPFDLVPEALLGPVGFLDDVALAAYAVHAAVNEVDPSIVQRHWTGGGDLLEVMRKVFGVADRMLGGGVRGRLIKKLWKA